MKGYSQKSHMSSVGGSADTERYAAQASTSGSCGERRADCAVTSIVMAAGQGRDGATLWAIFAGPLLPLVAPPKAPTAAAGTCA